MSVGLIIATTGIALVLLACVGVATYLFVDMRRRLRDSESSGKTVRARLAKQDADLRRHMAALTKKYGSLVQPDGSLSLEKGACVQFRGSNNRICDKADSGLAVPGRFTVQGSRLCVDDACVDNAQFAKLIKGGSPHADPVPPPPPTI